MNSDMIKTDNCNCRGLENRISGTNDMQNTEDNHSLDDIFSKYRKSPESLIPILQEIQLENSFLSEFSLKETSARLEIPLIQVYAVATFYNAFSLKPKGKYNIQVCMGTACHVRGAEEIVEELENILNIKRGNTTDDCKFSIETVNCVGACALGPVIVINGNYHGHLTREMIEPILKEYV
ncbi:MAG TPA: NAD(P)H-dependent oxidoreductase subunit E [Victivallales bacterium]|nr:NAD(P)H-dependent oxidoreductase subunit E [Victivallales bacterium]